MEGHEVGNWVIETELGAGGMGTVYRAHHKVLKTPAAVKLLLPALTFEKKFRDRFFLEAQTQAQLRHPNIAQVLDYVEQDGKWFLVIEYLENGSLADRIDRTGGPVSIPLALQWISQALQALDVAHQNAVIHRDVKSANILLDGFDNAKVTDFGIVMVLGGERLTSTGAALGTPHYMSPEQIVDPHSVDHRTDVYSIGIVLYELLAGKVPFESTSDFKVREAQVNLPPPGVCELNPEVSPALEEVLMRALAKEPDQRYSGCGEFAREIQGFLSGESQVRPAAAANGESTANVAPGRSAEPLASPRPAANRRSVALSIVIIAMVVLLGAGLAFLGWSWSGQVDDHSPPVGTSPPMENPFEREAELVAGARRLADGGNVAGALDVLQAGCKKHPCSRSTLQIYLELADQADANDSALDAYVAERMAVVEGLMEAKSYKEAQEVLELVLLADPHNETALEVNNNIARHFVREAPPPPRSPPPVPSVIEYQWPCERSREIVYFDFDECELVDELQQRKLLDLVSWLNACPQLSACIAGRAKDDESPTCAVRRGDIIARFLSQEGVDASRVSTSCDTPWGAGTLADIYLDEK